MIKIENAVFPSAQQWEAVIRGMRNPKNSWDKMDSDFSNDTPLFGPNDRKLMKTLCKAESPEHAKFLRQLPVILDIKAPLYWWKQMETYKVGTVTNSTSTMHTLMDKPFDFSDFSTERFGIEALCTTNYGVNTETFLVANDAFNWKYIYPVDLLGITIEILNDYINRYQECKAANDKKGMTCYFNVVQSLLPQCFIQRRTWSANYEVLRTICRQRKGHKLSEWKEFIDWIYDNVPYAKELIFNEWDCAVMFDKGPLKEGYRGVKLFYSTLSQFIQMCDLECDMKEEIDEGTNAFMVTATLTGIFQKED